MTKDMLRNVGAAAAAGDLMTGSKKEANDWKLRMLKAGLSKSGLMIPANWDTLSEDEKETRLNKVIAVALGKEDK